MAIIATNSKYERMDTKRLKGFYTFYGNLKPITCTLKIQYKYEGLSRCIK